MIKIVCSFMTTLLFCLPGKAAMEYYHLPSMPSHFTPADTSDPRIKEFKVFAAKFFTAVKNADTTFLKAHIIFPIVNSSFNVLDGSLDHVKKITASIFFRRLRKLFPDDYMRDIRKSGTYTLYKDKNDGEINYVVSLYYDRGGVDANANWFFIKKDDQFYFNDFTAEAG
jgi:hypothetical protein